VRARLLTEQANRYAQSFYGDVDLQRYLYQRQPPRPLAIRPDDPVRGSLAAPHTVVVFSDFQCPGCRSFAQFSERELLPRFGNQLRLVYKHFPLAAECNPGMQQTAHPQACEAAFAAEAAREIGGNDAFWKMHDVLFAQQAALGQIPWTDLASQAGLDGAAVADRVSRRAAQNRVAQDAQLGRAVELGQTPTIFLDGRPLEDWGRLEVWQAVLGQAPVPPAPSAVP
jgi:protein-disulfide isomerase